MLSPRIVTPILLASAVLLCCGISAGALEVDRNNVVIVLDASGSMNDKMSGTGIKKMDAAKTALKEVLRQVPDDTNIGLLVFSSAKDRSGWLYPLGPRVDAELYRAIDMAAPGGQTPLGQYIKIGADRLLKQRADQFGYGTYRLLVVTDGEANDPGLVEKNVPEVLSRGITVDVIGVDMARTHTLAKKAHSYRKADDPESLKKAIADVFAEIGGAGTDTADEEAFEIISGIPDETASAMLRALSASGNSPIGEKPAPQPPVEDKSVSGPPATAVPAKATPPDGSAVTSIRTLLIIAAVVIFIILQFTRKRSKR